MFQFKFVEFYIQYLFGHKMPKLLKKHRRALKEIYEQFIGPDNLDDNHLLEIVQFYLSDKLDDFERQFELLYASKKFDLGSRLRLELIIQEIQDFNDNNKQDVFLIFRQAFSGFSQQAKAVKDEEKKAPEPMDIQFQKFDDCQQFSDNQQGKPQEGEPPQRETEKNQQKKSTIHTNKSHKPKYKEKGIDKDGSSVCDILSNGKYPNRIIFCILQSKDYNYKFINIKENRQIKSLDKIDTINCSIYSSQRSQFQNAELTQTPKGLFTTLSQKKKNFKSLLQKQSSLYIYDGQNHSQLDVIKSKIFSIFLKLCEIKKANRKLTDQLFVVHIKSLARIFKDLPSLYDFAFVNLDQIRNQLTDYQINKYFMLFWFEIFGPASLENLVYNNLLSRSRDLIQKFRDQTQQFGESKIFSEFVSFLKKTQFYSAVNYNSDTRYGEQQAEKLFLEIWNQQQRRFEFCRLICYVKPQFLFKLNDIILISEDIQHPLNAPQFFVLNMLALEREFALSHFLNEDQKSSLIQQKLGLVGNYISRVQFNNYIQDHQSSLQHRRLFENHSNALNRVFFWNGYNDSQNFVLNKKSSIEIYRLYKKHFFKYQQLNLYFENNLNYLLLDAWAHDKSKFYDLVTVAAIGERKDRQFNIIFQLLETIKIDENLLIRITSLLNEQQYDAYRIIQILKYYYAQSSHRFQFAQTNVLQILQKIQTKNIHLKLVQQILQLLVVDWKSKPQEKRSHIYHLKAALKSKNTQVQQKYFKSVLAQVVEYLRQEKKKDEKIHKELHQQIPNMLDLQYGDEKVYFRVVYSLENFRYNSSPDQIFTIMKEKPKMLDYQKTYFQKDFIAALKSIEKRLNQKRLLYQQLQMLQKNLPLFKNTISEFFDIEKILLNISKELTQFQRKSQIIIQLLSLNKISSQAVKQLPNFQAKLSSMNINEAMTPQAQLSQLYDIAIKVDFLRKTDYWQCQAAVESDSSIKSEKSQLIIQEGIKKISDFGRVYETSMGYLREQITKLIQNDMTFQQFSLRFLKQENIISLLQNCLDQSQSRPLEIMKLALNKVNQQYIEKCLQKLKLLNNFTKLTKFIAKVKHLRMERTIQRFIKQPSTFEINYMIKQINSVQEELENVFALDKNKNETFALLEKDPAFNIINLTIKYVKLFEYCEVEKINKQITQQILEYLDDIQSTSLGFDAIKDFERIIDYFQHIKLVDNLEDLIKYLKNNISDTKYLLVCYENCFSLRFQFEQIVWKAKNRQLSFKCEIQQIFRGSIFSCSCQPQVKIQIYLDNVSQNNKSKLITYKDMSLFKEKSLLIIRDMKKAQKQNMTPVNDTISLLQKFQVFFTFIEKIYKELVTLGNYGFSISLLNFKENIHDGQYEDIIALQSRLSRQENKWITFIKEIYTRSYLLTHYIGPQLNNFIQINQKQEYLPVFQRILKIDKQKFGRVCKLDHNYRQNLSKFRQAKDYYEKVSFLQQAFQSININENEDQTENKIMIIKCNPCDTYSALLRPKHSKKEKQSQRQYEFAQSTQVLFCEQDTNCEQIEIFMYRALIYWSKRHYIIACNNLSEDVKLHFSDLLISLNKNRKQDFSKAQLCFVVNTYDKIIGLLTKPRQFNHERKEIFEKQSKELSKQMIKHISKSIVVESVRAGLGKTFRVEKEARKQLVYFPICGNIRFQNLYKRLKEILKIHEQFTLLIQIGHVQNKQKLQVFLAQMVLFRSFYYQQYLFLPPDTQIFIEMENIFEPLQSKQNKKVYHIIQMLKNQKQYINIEKFDAEQIIFDQKNYQEKFSLIYLDLVRTGEILNHQLSYKYSYEGNQKQFKSPSQKTNQANIKYFFADWFNQKKQEPTFLIYKSFLKMLFNAFKAFSDSPHLHKEQFQQLPEHYKVLRLQEVRKQFLDICIENILEFLEQSITTNDFSDNKNKEFQRKFQDKIKEIPLLIVPNADYQGYEFVYLDEKKVNFPIKSLLVKSNAELNRKLKRVNNQDTIHQIFNETALNSNDEQLIFRLCDIIYHISNNKKFETNFVKNQNMPLKELYEKVPKLKFYKITIDNFYKMCLIILRVLSGVPSIVMGESGVGKTALIEFLVNEVFEDKLLVYNVHAGIHQKQIAKWIQQIKDQLQSSQQLQEIQKQNKQQKRNKKRVWVFFDQFNTSDQLSYFKEIIIDRRFMGHKLPDSIIFLAACNPYRYQKQRKINSGLAIQEKLGQTKQLAFKVKPPCLSMIQIMWDYQQLKKQEIKQYVQSMIKQVQFTQKRRLSNAIVQAHEYFKNNIQISSVSLRDVTRFRQLYNWLLCNMPTKQHKKRKNHLNLQKSGTEINNYELVRDDRAVILSFCFCYSLRIQNRKHRMEFLNFAEKTLKMPVNFMITVLQNQQIDYINRLKHSQEKIAYNAALMENLFATLICLMNRIPILIIGNPGSSKSISIKMLDSNLKGINSQSEFCKNFPAINLLNFQGSESSTSEGVQKIYEKAETKKKQEDKNRSPNDKKSEVLQCILFDEIGLAQKSVHNPLKVLHSKLQTHKKELGFIGISNYELDAAKMSRFLVLAHANPDRNEIKDTAVKIYGSYFQDNIRYQQKFKKLGQYYFDFVEEWNKNPQNRHNFFGLRDFYSYIKFICLEMKKAQFNYGKIQKIILKSIQTNFDGQPNSVELFCKIAQIKDEIQQINPIDLVIENLSNVQSRCLMLIIKNEALIPMINDSIVIKGQKREVVCIYGSTFEADKQSEEYNLQITSKIISYVSRGAILVFKDINNSIQTSLYDLFNKSFSHRNNIKTCRIAVGANSNPKCTVHENFNAIVYVQEEMVKKLDLPFINRLQKHELNIMKMIQPQDYQILEQIKNWMKTITYKQTDIKLKNHNFIVNSSQQALVTLIFKHREAANAIQEVKKDLLKNRTIDFQIILKEKDEKLKQQVERLSKNIQPYNNCKKDMIIYTYDQFSNTFEQMQENTNRSYSIRLGELKAEKDLRTQLLFGLNSQEYTKIEIFVNYQHEFMHLNYLLFVARQIKSQIQIDKQIVIVIQLHRFTFIKEKTEGLNISYLHKYEQYFVQDISRSSNLQTLLESQTFFEIYHKMNMSQKLQIHHLQALKLIKFKCQDSTSNDLAIQAFQIAAQMVTTNSYYRDQIQYIVLKNLKSMKVDLKQLQTVNQIVLYSSNIFQALQKYVLSIVQQIIVHFLINIISEGLLINPTVVVKLLNKKDHLQVTSPQLPKLQEVYKSFFVENALNFEKKLATIRQGKITRLVQNNDAKLPIFLSVFPQSFKDFSLIFKMGSQASVQSMLQQIKFKIYSQRQEIAELENKLEGIKSKFQNIRLRKTKLQLNQTAYFYDCFMFNMYLSKIILDPSEQIQLFIFFKDLLEQLQYKTEEKIIFLLTNRTFMENLINLLVPLFKITNSSKFGHNILEQMPQQQYPIINLLIVIAQKALEKACSFIKLEAASLDKFYTNSIEQFIKFIRVIYRKMKIFGKNFMQIEKLSIDSQFDSIFKFIQFLNTLKKHERGNSQEKMLADFLQSNNENGSSLNFRIFNYVQSYLVKESNEVINQEIIDYLSLLVWPQWNQKLDEFPAQREESIQRFIALCNKYVLFANNSTFFFSCLFYELQQQNFKQIYEKMKELDTNKRINLKSQQINFKNNFSIAFGNYLQCLFSRLLRNYEQAQLSQFLSDQYELFTEFCEMKQIKNNFVGVFILEFLKFYGKSYINLLEKGQNIDLLVRVDKTLCCNNQQTRHLRVFLLKELYQVKKDFSQIKKNYIQGNQKWKWITLLADYIEEKKIELFLPPLMYDRDQDYLKLLTKFQNQKFKNLKVFHQIIRSAFYQDNPWNLYEVLNFFMLKFYRRQCNQETIQILISQIDHRSDVNQPRFYTFYHLLRCYLMHKVTQRFVYNEDSFKQHIVFLNYLNLIVAGKGLRVPFNNMFFDENGLVSRDYPKWLQQRYLIGTIHNPAAKRVEFILQRHKMNMQGNSYTICSNVCDYIGPVGGTFYGKNDGCAHPLNNAKCPFCGGVLGAHSYNVLTNAEKGARVIDPKNVESELPRINEKKTIQILYNQKKMQLQLIGYQHGNSVQHLQGYLQMIKQFDGICFDRMKQNGDMLSYKLLQFLTYLTWYFFSQFSIISTDHVQSIWKKTKRETTQFLYEACMFYQSDIRKCLKIDTNDDFIVWNLGIASELQQFYNLYDSKKLDIELTKVQVRNNFQQDFEQVFSVCYEKQKQALINQSRNFEQKDKTDIIKQIGSLQQHQAQFRYIAMFKIIKRSPCYEDMKTSYKNTIIKSYPVLAYIIENEDIAEKLKHYKQIFIFLSALQQLFDGKVKRLQSDRPLKVMLQFTNGSSALLGLLDEFLRSWNSLAKDKFQLKIDCHSQKVLGNLPQITADSPLRMFLMDRKTTNNEHAERLLAFVEIASRQYNQRAQTIERLIVTSYPYYNELKVFSTIPLNPTFILNNFSQLVVFPLERLTQLVDSYSSQSVKYGEAKSHYSLQNIQRVLIKEFIGCKYMISEKDKFKYISYIGEKSHFIAELRDREDQKTLQQMGFKQKVQKYFNDLQKNQKNSFEKEVKLIQSSLEQIIAFYMNIRDKHRISNQTISEFITTYQMKGIVPRLKQNPLDQIFNSCLADFYEFVQNYSFEGVQQMLDPSYNQEFDAAEKQRMKRLILKLKTSDGKSIPLYNDFKHALYRFTGRILTVAGSNENIKLSDYLCEEAYWPKTLQADQAMRELSKYLDDMKISKVGSLLREVPFKNVQQAKPIAKPKEEKISNPQPNVANKKNKVFQKKMRSDDT